jgi:predicted nuclease of predicted toxin-antitoxin system
MRLKLDENLGRSPQRALREAGHDVEHVHDEGLSGEGDVRVWQQACAEGRMLVTLDLDFSDVRRFPPGSHPGILLHRPKSRSRDAVLRVLGRLVDEDALEGLAGCLMVADERGTTIRRPG